MDSTNKDVGTPPTTGDQSDVQARYGNYLGNGGFFNPEMMEHQKVADLLRDFSAELTRLGAERDHYLETLAATRDVLVVFGKQAGWLPEQQAYSTRMTESERELADAVTAIDAVLSGAARLAREPHQEKEK